VSDYYQLLRTAVDRINSVDDRLVIYNRARHAMLSRLRSVQPPISDTALEAEQNALELAIQRIEREFYRGEDRDAVTFQPIGEIAKSDRTRQLPSLLKTSTAVAFTALFIVIAGYSTWSLLGRKQAPATRAAAPRVVEIDDRQPPTSSPGSKPAYVFLRQVVYYRTTHPIGTVIIDKAQRFLYLTRPNVAAVRYGIGLGRECVNTNGILRISRKEELPKSRSPRGEAANQTVSVQLVAGRSSPLGARAVYLNSDDQIIHGTVRLDTIGHSVWLGCFRLSNDDVIELYDQVSVGGRVVVIN
jgi:lipoprotein-anchoring transpeptidase ErfK/SrfK